MTRPEWMPESITDDLVDAMEASVAAYDGGRADEGIFMPAYYNGTRLNWIRAVHMVHTHYDNWRMQQGENPELPSPVEDLPPRPEEIDRGFIKLAALEKITLSAIDHKYTATEIEAILAAFAKWESV